LKGTWYIATGPAADTYNPNAMTPVKAGTFIYEPPAPVRPFDAMIASTCTTISRNARRSTLPGRGMESPVWGVGMTPSDRGTVVRLKRILLAVLGLGFFGLAVDLTLLAHYEDPLQVVPLVLAGLGLLTAVWHGVVPSSLSLVSLRIAMTMAVAGAAIGVTLHYRGSMEFQLEMDPALGGIELLMKVLRAKAPPTMAPLNLAWLGLIGLASTYGERSRTQEDS
jgi:hypothetical protein